MLHDLAFSKMTPKFCGEGVKGTTNGKKNLIPGWGIHSVTPSLPVRHFEHPLTSV